MHIKSKSIVALFLVVMTIATMFVPAMAMNTTGQTPVSLTSEAAIFNVSVPTVLPVGADEQGNITVANDVKISNSSWGPIYIAGLDVAAQNSWAIDGYDTSAMYAEKVDAKKIAMVINNCKTTSTGSIAYAVENFPRLEGSGGHNWIGIDYFAKLPAQHTALNKVVPMSVVFTIAWLTASSPSTVPENTATPDAEDPDNTFNLKVSDVPDSLVIGQESTLTATQDAGDVTWSSSNTSVIKVTPVTSGSSLSIANILDKFILTAAAAESTTSTATIKAVGLGMSTITVANIDGYMVQQDVYVIKNELSELTVIAAPSKTVYSAGEIFDPTDMVIQGAYLNGDTYTIEAYNYSKIPLVQGQTTEFIQYTEQGITKSVTVPITVNAAAAALSEIKVSQAPNKITYVESQVFDSTGMVITAYYSDGTSVDITDYTVNKSHLVMGDTQVVISYKTKTITTPVTVVEVALDKIEVTTAPTKTAYIEGNTFASTGMAVTGTYNNGTTGAITGYTVDKTTLVAGDSQVVVSFGGKQAIVPITVATKSLSSIAVTTAPIKTTYIEGNTFASTGMVVTGTYDNGTTSAITGYTVDKTTLVAGDSQVVVSFGGKQAIVPITVAVKTLTRIDVTTAPAKTTYIEGQNFDKAGMVVTATYDNGSTASVSEYSVSNGTALILGQTSVNIEYGGQTCSMSIIVSAKQLSSIAVTTTPTKTSYIEGNLFVPAGMVVTAAYNNGTFATVSDYAYPMTALGVGETSVTVSYGGKTATTPITVATKSLSSIAVTTAPTKTAYIEGNTFDKAGMVVTASYNNGTTGVVTGYTIDKTTLATSDTQVTVSYGGKTATTPVTVAAKSLSSIAVTTAPTKTAYIEGNTFASTGMVVTGTYDNGTTSAITGYTVDKTTLVAGDSQVVVSFGGKQAIVPITVVVKTLARIDVTTAPAKITYIEGQSFDKAGMVVTATYDNGSTAAVSEYSVSDGTAMTAGQDTVTIAYGGESCTTLITVAAKTLTSIAVTTAPTKTAYSIGEFFAPAGMIVTAYYDNGAFATISGYSYPMTAFVGGETSVTITYGGKSCTTPVALPANITDYYTFTDDTSTTGGYKISLNASFKTALQANSGTGAAYKDWMPGTVLPNPGSMYNGKPVTSMASLFNGMTTVKALNLTDWDTANVTSLSYMFNNCSGLTSLNLSSFNTANITDMQSLFYGCSTLTSLDLSLFNTAKVTNMFCMFARCSKLISLDLSSFNTANVVNMSGMFNNSTGLTSLDLTSFNTDKVTVMGNMFYGCSGLISLNLSSFNTANATDLGGMFYNCSKLTSLNLSSFNTANVTNMFNMFYGCSGLTSLDLTSFNTAKVTSMAGMFNSCSKLTSLDLSSFNTAKVTAMSSMFQSCTKVTTAYAMTSADVTKLNASSNKPATFTFVVKP